MPAGFICSGITHGAAVRPSAHEAFRNAVPESRRSLALPAYTAGTTSMFRYERCLLIVTPLVTPGRTAPSPFAGSRSHSP